MTHVTIRRIWFVPVWSSEWIKLKRRAWASRDDAYAASPTPVARTLPVPATTKLPESTGSPVFFVTGSASPLRRDSSISRPSQVDTTASTGTWSPGPNSRTSSRTTWSSGSLTTWPSRTI